MATFGFRIRFHVEPTRRFASEANPIAFDVRATLKGLDHEKMAQASRLALRIDGFATAVEAELNGQRWTDAITIAGARLGIGFDVGRFARPTSSVSAYGKALLERDHGIVARNDLHGLDVFALDHARETTFVSLNGKAHVTSEVGRLVAALQASLPAQPLPPKLRLALDLFGVSAFEPSPRVRFLILISAFEVLSERAASSRAALTRIKRWEKTTSSSPDPGVQLLHERLRELKRDSIGAACRRLVRDHVGAADVIAFKKLYATRSTLVHDGEVADHDFVNSAEGAKMMLRKIVDSLLAAHVPPMPEGILTGQGPPLAQTAD